MTLTLNVERDGAAKDVVVDSRALAVVISALEALSHRVEAQPPRLDGILALNGVLVERQHTLDPEAEAALHAAILAVADESLAGLVAARRGEGTHLAAIIRQRLDEIETLVARAETHPARSRDAILARLRTQVRRKRFSDRLRDNVQMTMEMAVTDGLTGLHNRRYLERHLATLVRQAIARGKALSVLVLDIDHFKVINDGHGHAAGDEVLREFSRRVRKAVRGIDLACRLGGEEFVVAMPDTDAALAMLVGERLRQKIASEPFGLPEGGSLPVTVSIGISSLIGAEDTPQALLNRADSALYRAKRDGRNRVVSAAA